MLLGSYIGGRRRSVSTGLCALVFIVYRGVVGVCWVMEDVRSESAIVCWSLGASLSNMTYKNLGWGGGRGEWGDEEGI